MLEVIEIQTVESGRLNWVAIFMSTKPGSAFQWGNELLSGFRDPRMKPNIRITAGLFGPVVGAWQPEGYEETK